MEKISTMKSAKSRYRCEPAFYILSTTITATIPFIYIRRHTYMKVIIDEKPSVGRDMAKVFAATIMKDWYMEGEGYTFTRAVSLRTTLQAVYRDVMKLMKPRNCTTRQLYGPS
jgi:hypothetical protein